MEEVKFFVETKQFLDKNWFLTKEVLSPQEGEKYIKQATKWQGRHSLRESYRLVQVIKKVLTQNTIVQ